MKNPAIKKAFAESEWTPELMDELMLCQYDPIHCIKTYVKVQHPTKGVVPFNLYDYQEEVIRALVENRCVCVLQARQTGKTITIAIFLMWYSMFTDDKLILIASKSNAHAIEIMDRIRFAYEEMPAWLKPGVKYYNKHQICFDNGSRIVCEATTEKTGRGLSPSKIYLDELAFINPRVQKGLWSSLVPSLSTGGSFIISSTPNGDTDLFATIWRQAMAEISLFKAIYIPWYRHPERAQQYWDEMMIELGELVCRQEVGCCGAETSINISINGNVQNTTIGDLYDFLDKRQNQICD